MNICKFKKGQDVFVISGHYKKGFSYKHYYFDGEARNGLYWIRDNEDRFIIKPYLVFESKKAAHASLMSKFNFWIKREKERYQND